MKISHAYLTLLLFVVTSCSIVHQIPTKPPIDLDPSYLNRQIRLLIVKEFGPLRTNTDVAILLQYYTTNRIVFPSDYNLRIFIEQEGKRVEIAEKPAIRPKDPIVLSPDNPSSYGHIVGFWPQYPDPNKTYYLRVYVFGDMTTPDGIKKVAAFVDFVVTP